MNYTIIFLSIILIVISIMLVIKISIQADFDNMKIKILIKIYSLKILVVDIDLLTFTYRINNNNRIKSLSIFISKTEEYFLKQIKKSILDKLYIDDIVFNSYVGLNYANQTAIAIGILDSICNYLSTQFEINKLDKRLYYKNTANFNSSTFVFDFSIKVYFTLFDMLFAVIMSFYKRGMYVKKNRKKS